MKKLFEWEGRGGIAELISLFAALIGVVACIVSCGALGVSIWSTNESYQYNRHAMRPIIQMQRVLAPYEGLPSVGLYIVNWGNGVAFIDRFSVQVDGKPIPNLKSDGFEAVARELDLLNRSGFSLRFVRNSPEALPAGERLLLLGFKNEDCNDETYPILKNALSRISIHVEYRSIYGDFYQKDF